MTDPLLINAIGATASTISFVLWLPQATATWKNRHNREALAGISLGTQILVMVNAALWFLYAIIVSEFWVGAPGLINLPLAAATTFLILRARHNHKADKQLPLPATGNIPVTPAST